VGALNPAEDFGGRKARIDELGVRIETWTQVHQQLVHPE